MTDHEELLKRIRAGDTAKTPASMMSHTIHSGELLAATYDARVAAPPLPAPDAEAGPAMASTTRHRASLHAASLCIHHGRRVVATSCDKRFSPRKLPNPTPFLSGVPNTGVVVRLTRYSMSGVSWPRCLRSHCPQDETTSRDSRMREPSARACAAVSYCLHLHDPPKSWSCASSTVFGLGPGLSGPPGAAVAHEG